MGQRHSTEQQKPQGGSGSAVRTGTTNSALVNNFGDMIFPLTGDAAVSATPRSRNTNQHQVGSTTPGRGTQQQQQQDSSSSTATPAKDTSSYQPPSQQQGEDAQLSSQQGQTTKSVADNNTSSSTTSPPRRQQLGMKPYTTSLCLRYKYQEKKSTQPQAPQGNQSNKGPALPPPPQQSVAVELFDNTGKQTATVPLNASEGEFFAVVEVPTPAPGDSRPLNQYFRFIVDGHRGVCHPHLPAQPLNPANPQEQANVVQVFGCEEDSEQSNEQQQQSSSNNNNNQQQQQAPAPLPNAVHSSSIIHDDDGWGQQIPTFEETRKFPPIMPPHLRYTPLNAPPSNLRILSDEQEKAALSKEQQQEERSSLLKNPDASSSASSTKKDADAAKDRTLTAIEDDSLVPAMLEGSDQRPAPLSVTINHVYFQKREDHTLVGITTRYQDKCTSIAYYKHDPLPVGAVPLPMPLHR